MASNVTRDHHNLRRNLNLNDNYISNDGGDEGIKISDIGAVTIDSNSTSTIEQTTKGLEIDYDHTGSTSTDQTIMGLDVDTRSTTATGGSQTLYGAKVYAQLSAASGSGSTNSFGLHTTVLGNQVSAVDYATAAHLEVSGTDLNTGLYIKCQDGGDDVKIISSANSSDYFKIQVIADGETTLTTNESGGSTAHLNMVADGNFTVDAVGGIILNSDSGSITAADGLGAYTPAIASSITTKAYVDANMYHFIRVGFYNSGTTKMYMPMPGSEDMREVTSPAFAAERLSFICPFDGSLETVWARSEGTPGSTVIGFHKSAGAGFEVPSVTATQTVTVAMDVDDTSYEFDFASAGTNTFAQGDIIVFSVDPSAAMNDVHFMIVLKFDVST